MDQRRRKVRFIEATEPPKKKSPLPPGHQYVAHDRPGGRAATCRSRQVAKQLGVLDLAHCDKHPYHNVGCGDCVEATWEDKNGQTNLPEPTDAHCDSHAVYTPGCDECLAEAED
jgi:hypothetical protein